MKTLLVFSFFFVSSVLTAQEKIYCRNPSTPNSTIHRNYDLYQFQNLVINQQKFSTIVLVNKTLNQSEVEVINTEIRFTHIENITNGKLIKIENQEPFELIKDDSGNFFKRIKFLVRSTHAPFSQVSYTQDFGCTQSIQDLDDLEYFAPVESLD